MIKSGNTTINAMAFKDLSKDESYEILKGKLEDDFELIYKLICKENGNDASIEKPSVKSKKS